MLGDGDNHKRIIKNFNDGSGVQLNNGLWANLIVYNQTKGIVGKYDGLFPLSVAIKNNVYLHPQTNKFYICKEAYKGSVLNNPNELNFEELSLFKNKIEVPNKLEEFNNNATQKTNEFNNNVNNKKEQLYSDLENKSSLEGTKQINLVQAEGTKVVEQVKTIVSVNPATTNALTLSGKTRVEFEQDTQDVLDKFNKNVFDVVPQIQNIKWNNGYIDANGVITDGHRSFRYSDLIDVSNITSIVYKNLRAIKDYLLIATYDKNNNFIKEFSVIGNNNFLSGEFIIPNTIKKIRLSKYETSSYPDLDEVISYSYFSKINKNENNISNIDKQVFVPQTKEYTNNDSDNFIFGYIDIYGQPQKHAVCQYIDYIPVTKGTIIKCKNIYGIELLPVIVAYDMNKNFMRSFSKIAESDQYIDNLDYTVPDGVYYIRILVKIDINFPLSIKIPLKKDRFDLLIQSISQDVLYNKQYDATFLKSSQLGYIGQDGNVITHTVYRTTDYIEVLPNTTIECYRVRGIPPYPAIAMYDINKKYIKESSIIPSSSEFFDKKINIPKNIHYIKVTGYPSSSENFSINVPIKVKIKGNIPPWNMKKWYAFGTSITDTNNTLGIDGSCTGKYIPYLSKLSGMICINNGIAGGTIGKGGIHGGSGDILKRIKSTNISDADLITIEGFVNDFAVAVSIGRLEDTSDTTMYGAITQAVTYCLQNSKATIVLITESIGREFQLSTGLADYKTTRKNSLNLTQNDYNEVIRNVAKFLGVHCIDAGAKSQINEYSPQFLADQIHHSELGGKQYAETIWEELKNIHCSNFK